MDSTTQGKSRSSPNSTFSALILYRILKNKPSGSGFKTNSEMKKQQIAKGNAIIPPSPNPLPSTYGPTTDPTVPVTMFDIFKIFSKSSQKTGTLGEKFVW